MTFPLTQNYIPGVTLPKYPLKTLDSHSAEEEGKNETSNSNNNNHNGDSSSSSSFSLRRKTTTTDNESKIYFSHYLFKYERCQQQQNDEIEQQASLDITSSSPSASSQVIFQLCPISNNTNKDNSASVASGDSKIATAAASDFGCDENASEYFSVDIEHFIDLAMWYINQPSQRKICGVTDESDYCIQCPIPSSKKQESSLSSSSSISGSNQEEEEENLFQCNGRNLKCPERYTTKMYTNSEWAGSKLQCSDGGRMVIGWKGGTNNRDSHSVFYSVEGWIESCDYDFDEEYNVDYFYQNFIPGGKPLLCSDLDNNDDEECLGFCQLLSEAATWIAPPQPKGEKSNQAAGPTATTEKQFPIQNENGNMNGVDNTLTGAGSINKNLSSFNSNAENKSSQSINTVWNYRGMGLMFLTVSFLVGFAYMLQSKSRRQTWGKYLLLMKQIGGGGKAGNKYQADHNGDNAGNYELLQMAELS